MARLSMKQNDHISALLKRCKIVICLLVLSLELHSLTTKNKEISSLDCGLKLKRNQKSINMFLKM